MTDKEAYELLVKYGGEQSILLIKEMIHVAGIDKALENTEKAASNQGKPMSDDMKAWMRQAYTYLLETINQHN